jgi:hypothetical protein
MSSKEALLKIGSTITIGREPYKVVGYHKPNGVWEVKIENRVTGKTGSLSCRGLEMYLEAKRHHGRI